MLSVENRVISGCSGLVVEVLGAYVTDRAWDGSGHLGCRVEITDTLELNGLGGLDPELTDREIQRDALLLSECGVEGQLTEPGKETANLFGRAIADLSNGLHIYGHFIFVGTGGWNSLIVL